MTNLFGKMGIVCRPRVEEYYGYPIRTKSGSIATITDGANNVPIRDGVFNIDYDANGYSWIRLCKSALNLCGGEAFLHNANRYLPAITINTENKYFSYPAAANPTSDTGGFSGSLTGRFKENTQYTFIITAEKPSATSRSLNMRLYYTDGTYENLTLPVGMEANTKYTVAIVSSASKNLNYWSKYNSSGTTKIYYDECGIFEGVLTAQDFESWSGEETFLPFVLGKNLIKNDSSAWEAGTIDTSTGANTSGNFQRTRTYFPIHKGNIVISGIIPPQDTANIRFFFYDINGQFLFYRAYSASISITNQDVAFFRIRYADSLSLDISALQIEYGTTATAYEPYVNIYGGYFDSVSGVLVSTKAADGTDLSEPDIYELIPVELRTDEGETNIWCDTGDSMIRYRSYYKTDSKTITANGTYLASDDDLDGYDEVTVTVSGGQTLTLHEGKISMSDGSIVADSDYYYSDFFDAPNGNVLFDLGEIDNDFGLPWYHSDGTYVDHFSSSQRFRQVNMATYYQSGDKFRLTFKKAYLSSALLVDFANIKTYCVSAIKLAE